MLPRRVPFIPQSESAECGAASLAMLLAYYRHYTPLAELRDACGVSRDGTTAESLIRAARQYGCVASGVQVELEDLRDIPLPAILHWGFRHFVVLEAIRKRGLTVVDPLEGRKLVSLEECQREYTGVALIIEPSTTFKRRAQRYPSLRRYAAMFRTSGGTLLQILAASALLQLAAATFPIATQFLVDRVIGPRQEPWLWALGLALVAATLARIVLGTLRGWVVQNLQVALDFSLITILVRHLLNLPLSFYQRRPVGDLAQRVHGATVVRALLGTQGVSTILDVLQLITYATVMFAYHSRLALLVVTMGVVRVSLLAGLQRTKRQLMTAEQAALGREASALVEAFSTIETTKAVEAEGYLIARWGDRASQRVNASLPRQHIDLSAGRLMGFLQTTSLAAVLWVGGLEVVREEMTLGTFTAFLALQALFLGPLEGLLRNLDQLQYIGVHLRRVDDVLEAPVEPSHSAIQHNMTGAVSVLNVSFSYDADGPRILDDVSIELHPGEKVILVGPTGSGKSTLARLLLGLHQPTSGSIRFDGHDSRELDRAYLHQQIGVALQETFLFDDTIRANLTIRNPDATNDQLRRAAWLSCIDDVIDALPNTYETRIGENGHTLSAGQRQRLALARCLINTPRLLLLDEATSAVDLELEQRIHTRLNTLGCTRLVITHRLTAAKGADRAFILDGSRVLQVDASQLLGGADSLTTA